MIAFAQKGEVPANDQEKTLYDGIMTFALDNGSFLGRNWQTGELEYNEYTTGQCFQALVAYSRMVNGQSALFDLSDAAVAPRPKPEDEKPNPGLPRLRPLPNPPALGKRNPSRRLPVRLQT